MALLNDLRLQNGKSPLGFLNPLLYDMAVKYPNTFTDITQGTKWKIITIFGLFHLVANFGADINLCIIGSNPGCGTDGFPAAAGWDPSSGMGMFLLAIVVRPYYNLENFRIP